MITEEIILLKKEFERIKKMGYVKSTRGGTTGIGKTFEDLLGKKEDTSSDPDFHGIEIKTKRSYSKAYTTLFNCSPKGEAVVTKRLKNTYGRPDSVLPSFKVLNVSVQANCSTLVSNRYLFKLEVNKEEQRIYLAIYDKNFLLIEKKVFWDFHTLQARLTKKLNYLAFIKAWTTERGNVTYYKYYDISFYQLKDFENFLRLLEKGTIRVTFKLSIFRSGEKVGQLRDHGTGFEIQELDFEQLFNKIPI